MGTVLKKKKAKAKKTVKYSDDLPDLDNDPFFVKKAEEAKEMLRKSGIFLED